MIQDSSSLILSVTALSLGLTHTILGPDHYLPFIVLSKARNWSIFKTLIITALCGIGHVGSSVLLGTIGIVFGYSISRLEYFESSRGNIAGYLLTALGLIYFIWGIRKSYKKRSHDNFHIHSDGTSHQHNHTHFKEHVHIQSSAERSITPWVLFIIFVFGPCEPLIPLLMYPAAHNNVYDLILVVVLFTASTLFTMLAAVFISLSGIKLLPQKWMENYMHAAAGFIILFCGISIQFLGL
jgi:nickel/cobalt transporter (NicO) family protein